MKTFRTTLQAGLILLSLVFLPEHSIGQIYLTGLEQNGTAPNGQNAGSPIFNTLGNEVSFANIYVTQPNGGYNAPFINSGNGSSASISYALTTGTYQFYFFTMSFWNNNPGYYALNFFFGGDNTNPGISAYSPANTSTATAIAGGLATLSLDGDNNNPVPSPGTLVYTANYLSVTLTGYGYGEPGVFGGPAIDRVGNLSSQPDGYADAVGTFTLTVAPVPEPSPAAIFDAAVSIFLIFKMKPAHGNGRPTMKLPQIILLLSAATFLAGCGAPCPYYNRVQVAAFYGHNSRPQKKPYGTVIPFDTAKNVERPYRAIGFMSCEGNVGEEAGILKAMLYRAADMGADGIILNASSVSQEEVQPNKQKLNVNVTEGLAGEMIGNGSKRAFRAEAIEFTSTN